MYLLSQMMYLILFLMIFAVVQSEEKAGSCKDMLQGLTGQLSSVLGGYQVETMRREFKNVTDIIEKSIKELKGNVETKMRNIKSMSNITTHSI